MRMWKAREFLRETILNGYAGGTRLIRTRCRRLSDVSQDDNLLTWRLSVCTAHRGCFRRNGRRDTWFHVQYKEIQGHMFRGGYILVIDWKSADRLIESGWRLEAV